MSVVRAVTDTVLLAGHYRGEPAAMDSVRYKGGGTAQGTVQPSEFLRVADQVAKWIPAETLAIYLPGVSLLGRPAAWFLLLMIFATFAFAYLAAFKTGRRLGGETLVSSTLASIAFMIWSLSVPFSGWQQIPLIAKNSASVAVVAAVLGVLFSYLAELVADQVASRSR